MHPVPAPATDGAARPRLGRRDLAAAGVYAALACALAASGVHDGALVGDHRLWPPTVSIVLVLIASVSIAWRRRRPVVPLVVAGPLSILELVGGGQLSAYLLLFESLFEPVMHGSRALARVTTGLAIGLTALALVLVAVLAGIGPALLGAVLVATLVVATPLLWAWEVRHHRDARATAEALARSERELASTRSARAVENERRTIARDLHDVVAGHLSAVTLHTSLASTLEDARARDRCLLTARDFAKAALRDLRSMIAVLATDEAGTLPTATLDWESLTARVRAHDPDAHVTIDPALDDPAVVEPAVQAALLRIAAEAVTNALRHGRAPFALAVRVDREAVELVLANRRTEASAPGTGMGLEAIAHRAAAVGGHACSGPGPDGETWEVRARLPARPLPSGLGARTVPVRTTEPPA